MDGFNRNRSIRDDNDARDLALGRTGGFLNFLRVDMSRSVTGIADAAWIAKYVVAEGVWAVRAVCGRVVVISVFCSAIWALTLEGLTYADAPRPDFATYVARRGGDSVSDG